MNHSYALPAIVALLFTGCNEAANTTPPKGHEGDEQHHDSSAPAASERDGGDSNAANACQQLAATCDVDGLTKYCQDVGQAEDGADCASIRLECASLCAASDAGSPALPRPDAGSDRCEQLGSTCHDGLGELAQHCHRVGHAADVAECDSIYAGCIALCAPAAAHSQ